MNKVIECLKTRRSVRGFKSDEMPARELIASIGGGHVCPDGYGAAIAYHRGNHE